MFKLIKYLIVVTATLGAVIIPSAAYARPAVYQAPGYDGPIFPSPAPAAPSRHGAATSAAGFSWHDAGFGAAGALVLVAVGTGATLAVRRRTILS